MPERGDVSRTLQVDKDRLRPRISAGDLAAGLEAHGGSSRITI
jgi:hypothetical protein